MNTLKSKNIMSKKTSLLTVLFLVGYVSFSQIPGFPYINAGADQSICFDSCATLSATATLTGATTSYTVTSIPYTPPAAFNAGTPVLIGIDDHWSSAITLPFSFCFFGTQYNSVVIGSNEIISFDLSYASSFCPWSLTSGVAIPSSTYPLGSIMFPYQDIDPTNQGGTYWQIIGTAPSRMLVVSFYDVPYYGGTGSVSTDDCPSPPIYATSMMVLYESTNIIEVYIQEKDDCPEWNSGLAIEGIQDATGANAAYVPGRNNTVWTATNDAWRFTPNDVPNCAVSWWRGGTQIAAGTTTTTVCPDTTTTYTAQITYTNCDASQVTVSDQMVVNVFQPLQTPVISQSGDTLISSVAGGNQWYNTTSLIPGANDSIYVPVTTGNYFVIISDSNGCISDTSNKIYVVITGINNLSDNKNINIYPNPTFDNLTIESPQSAVIEITNIQGQLIKTFATTGNKTNIDVSAFPCGMYVVEVRMEKGVEVKKFVKE